MAPPKTKKTPANLTSVEDRKRVQAKVKIPKTENIIFIGSEQYYDSFWLKMMFIGAAYVKAKSLRKADKQTIAYVNEGYTFQEKLAIEHFRKNGKFDLVKLSTSSDLVNLLNQDRETYKLLDVAFFSHGVINQISLNYNGDGDAVDLSTANFSKVSAKAFAANGRLYSYACRTGVSVEDWKRGFNNEAEAKPEHSLAQKLADHFGIEVHAFLRRTFYGDVLREKSQSEVISSTLNSERETRNGQAIAIPPDHEALHHPGLADSLNPFSGPKREGTDNYALWRKNGGLQLPTAASSPTGLPTAMRAFKPKK